MLLLISFETRRKTQTQSSVQPERLRQQMEVWFYLNEEPRPRGQPTRRRIRKNLYPRSSEARRESFCPLDKDLSWKSRYRTFENQWTGAEKLQRALYAEDVRSTVLVSGKSKRNFRLADWASAV